jgi:hypothetical protein
LQNPCGEYFYKIKDCESVYLRWTSVILFWASQVVNFFAKTSHNYGPVLPPNIRDHRARGILSEFSNTIQYRRWEASWGVRFDVEINDGIEHLVNIFNKLNTFNFVFLHILRPHVMCTGVIGKSNSLPATQQSMTGSSLRWRAEKRPRRHY